MVDDHAHIASTRIDRQAVVAFDYLSSAQRLGEWARGMGETQVRPDGLVEGIYPGDGTPIFARIERSEDVGTIFYYLGSDPQRLVPRIMVRVVPAADLDRDAGSCTVSMIAWRQDSMDEPRWQALIDAHEDEIRLIRTLIESRS